MFVLSFYVEILMLLFIIFYCIEKAISKIYNKYLEYKSIKSPEDFIYYRDKLSDLTPAEIQLLSIERINYEDTILTSFINLEKNEYIKIINDEIKRTSKDTNNLTMYEKSLLCSTHVAFQKKLYAKFFKELVLEECEKKGYIGKISFIWLISNG